MFEDSNEYAACSAVSVRIHLDISRSSDPNDDDDAQQNAHFFLIRVLVLINAFADGRIKSEDGNNQQCFLHFKVK